MIKFLKIIILFYIFTSLNISLYANEEELVTSGIIVLDMLGDISTMLIIHSVIMLILSFALIFIPSFLGIRKFMHFVENRNFKNIWLGFSFFLLPLLSFIGIAMKLDASWSYILLLIIFLCVSIFGMALVLALLFSLFEKKFKRALVEFFIGNGLFIIFLITGYFVFEPIVELLASSYRGVPYLFIDIGIMIFVVYHAIVTGTSVF